eukprot:2881218-Amphidinium_carterae.1
MAKQLHSKRPTQRSALIRTGVLSCSKPGARCPSKLKESDRLAWSARHKNYQYLDQQEKTGHSYDLRVSYERNGGHTYHVSCPNHSKKTSLHLVGEP